MSLHLTFVSLHMKTPTITLRLDPTLVDEVDRHAERLGITRTDAVRQGLRLWLDQTVAALDTDGQNLGRVHTPTRDDRFVVTEIPGGKRMSRRHKPGCPCDMCKGVR